MISDQKCGLPILVSTRVALLVRWGSAGSPLTNLDAMERLSECHLTQHVEGGHFVPFCHVDTILVAALLANATNEYVHTGSDDFFLL